jgi:hypothetical protein
VGSVLYPHRITVDALGWALVIDEFGSIFNQVDKGKWLILEAKAREIAAAERGMAWIIDLYG